MELVKMTKSHVLADVHPDMVEQHLEHGWKIVEQPKEEATKVEAPKAKKAK